MAVIKKTLKVGQRCKIVKNGSCHNYELGTIVTICKISGTHIYVNGIGSYFYKADLESLHLTKEDLLKDIKKYEEEIQQCKSKIEFITETGSESYDEDQFKVYNILKMIEDPKTTKIQKSKLIAEMISK